MVRHTESQACQAPPHVRVLVDMHQQLEVPSIGPDELLQVLQLFLRNWGDGTSHRRCLIPRAAHTQACICWRSSRDSPRADDYPRCKPLQFPQSVESARLSVPVEHFALHDDAARHPNKKKQRWHRLVVSSRHPGGV